MHPSFGRPSVRPSVRPFLHPSLRICIRPSVRPYVHLSTSVHPSIYPFLHPSFHLSVSASICLPGRMCVHPPLYVRPSRRPPVRPPARPPARSSTDQTRCMPCSLLTGASLVKGIPFSTTDSDVAGLDIFRRLVSMEAHQDSSLYR